MGALRSGLRPGESDAGGECSIHVERACISPACASANVLTYEVGRRMGSRHSNEPDMCDEPPAAGRLVDAWFDS
jgi:hypothetical protein